MFTPYAPYPVVYTVAFPGVLLAVSVLCFGPCSALGIKEVAGALEPKEPPLDIVAFLCTQLEHMWKAGQQGLHIRVVQLWVEGLGVLGYLPKAPSGCTARNIASTAAMQTSS